MAFDSSVQLPRLGGWSSRRRLVELVVTASVAVAVVIVATLWSSDADVIEQPQLTRSDTVEPSPTSTPSIATDRATQARVTPSQTTTRVADDAISPSRTQLPIQSHIVPGRPDPAEQGHPIELHRYRVAGGESVANIAASFGIRVEELLRWNWDLSAAETLSEAQEIWIPRWDLSVVANESLDQSLNGKSGRGGG